MATYYIDALNGDNRNDGLSEGCPVKSEAVIEIKPGDAVLFKRGNVIRRKLYNVSGSKGNPVTYGAYGEGPKPVFCGSVDLCKEDLWYEEEKNIWVCEAIAGDEIGNFIFNDSKIYGTLKWTKADLLEQGDFFDECFGFRELSKKTVPQEHKVYLYSEGNPASVYTSIECSLYGSKSIADNGHDMIFENLKFINSGVHAIAGEWRSSDIKVTNCDFENIGGCVWSYELRIRFGNAIEFWDVAENIEITGCSFDNIYDSAVTHQGMDLCEPAKKFIINNNIFKKCGMAAYEQRDKMPFYAEFNNNICIDAGEGFSKLGVVMPRRSEIWPQPMGHHVFLWRIEDKTPGGVLKIKNNIFLNAPYGAAIYSIISLNAEKQIELEGNIYYTENQDLINRWNGRDYKSFEEYCCMEEKAQYKEINAELLISAK